ncbi:MAG TPA: hypothetical protein VIG97_11515 [Luteimonas sp.]
MSPCIFAIDPGTVQSGWAVYEDGRVLRSGVSANTDVMEMIEDAAREADIDVLAIEMVASYGMGVGAEVFRTVWWTGRFAEAWLRGRGQLPMEVFRKEVCLHLCHSARAKDGNVRLALIDLLGAPGRKAEPGPTYGVASHAWQALGVAVTAANKLQNPGA